MTPRPPRAALVGPEPPFDMGDTGRDLYAATEPIAYADPEFDWPWARFCASVAELLDPVSIMVRDDADGNEGWTALASPTRCPEPWLRVLAQWAGVRRWDALSSDDLRQLINGRAPGLWRGTRDALIAAVRRFYPPELAPEELLYFEERSVITGDELIDAYMLRVFTYSWVEHDPELVRTNLEAALPAGIKLIYEVRHGQAYFMLRNRLPAGGLRPPYAEAVLADGPVAYWRFGEPPGSLGVADEMGRLPGEYVGSQDPNRVPNPSFRVDLDGWLTEGGGAPGGPPSLAGAAIERSTARGVPTGIAIASCQVDSVGSSSGVMTHVPGPFHADLRYAVSGYLMGDVGGEAVLMQVGVGGAMMGPAAIVTTPAVNRFTYIWQPPQDLPDGAWVRFLGPATPARWFVSALQVTDTPAGVPYSDTQGVLLGVPGLLARDASTAVQLDSGFVRITPADPPELRTPEFTFECIVRAERWGGTLLDRWPPTLIRADPGGQVSFFTYFDDGASDYTSLAAPGALRLGEREHVVCTFDGARRRIYVNGEQRAADTADIDYASWRGPARLGFGGSYSYLGGVQDEVAMYDYALSPERAAEHARIARLGPGPYMDYVSVMEQYENYDAVRSDAPIVGRLAE